MPPGAKRDELITEAQRAIVAEDYEPKEPEMVNAVRQALEEASTQNRTELQKWITDLLWTDLTTKWKLYRTLEPESSVRSMARSARITVAMLEGLARNCRWNHKPFVVAARLTHLFWGLVEVAIPHCISELIFRY